MAFLYIFPWFHRHRIRFAGWTERNGIVIPGNRTASLGVRYERSSRRDGIDMRYEMNELASPLRNAVCTIPEIRLLLRVM